MSRTPQHRSLSVGILLLVVVASIAMATSWAAPMRRMIGPRLSLVVVILATLSGIGQLVSSVVAGVGKRGGWNAAVLPLSLGVSALCMALAFLPGGSEPVPHSLPLLGAALFAVAAAALQCRARERSEL